MPQFDNWPALQEFSFDKFSFPVDRYELWEDGKIIKSGETHFNIEFGWAGGVLKFGIVVQIENNPMPDLLKSTISFDKAITSGDRILFYIAATSSNVQHTSLELIKSFIGCTRDSKIYDKNEPILASVFTIDHKVAKVSFSLANPDRLIEFY